MGQEKLVSVIGNAYFQPIATLVEALLQESEPASDELKTTSREYGYSASICILSVVCLESWAMRLRVFNQTHPAAKERTALEFLVKLHPALPLQDELREAVVLRDTLVHNHVWEIDFSWDSTYRRTVDQATLAPGFGDRKYAASVDIATRMTRNLALNVVPLKVDRNDVRKVIDTVWTVLKYLEANDPNAGYLSHFALKFGGRKAYFNDVVAAL